MIIRFDYCEVSLPVHDTCKFTVSEDVHKKRGLDASGWFRRILDSDIHTQPTNMEQLGSL
jgi:hypothetical protein